VRLTELIEKARRGAPGRHRIALIDSPSRACGATIIVGQRDVENVTLDDVAALPVDIQNLTAEPAGGIEPGTKLPLASIRGRVLDETTGGPPPSGQIFISGKRGPSYALDEEGRFEIPNLLPGSYRLQVQVAGRPDVERDVELGIETLSLDVSLRKPD
jgi:hypothetical protein